jgi:WD40 repeat protein
MGLAPSSNQENPGTPKGAKVPVPISSQPSLAMLGAVLVALSLVAGGVPASGGQRLTITVLPSAGTEADAPAPADGAASLQCEVELALPLPLSAVAFSPNGQSLAVGGLGEVLLWDLAAGTLARRIGLDHEAAMVQAVAWTKDGRLLAAGQGVPCVSGTVILLDPQTAQPTAKFSEPRGPVNCLALSPDGTLLAAGCGDSIAYVWNLEEKRLAATLQQHALPVLSAAFSADGKFLVTGGADAMVQIWDTAAWQPDVRPTMVGGEVRRAMIRRSQARPDGDATHTFALLIGGREDRSLRVMIDGKAQEWQRRGDYLAHVAPGIPLDCVWLPKGPPKAFVACSDGTVKVFADAAQQLSHAATLRGHTDWVYGVALSADGAQLASASGDGTVRVWSTADEQLLATLVQPAPRSDAWLIVARDGWFATSDPAMVAWKSAGLDVTPEQLAALHNPGAVRQALAGKPPAAPPLP